MRSWTYNLAVGAIFAVLWGSGLIFEIFGWCERHIGGWFAPALIGFAGLILVAIPIIRGALEGAAEAEDSRAA